MLLIGGVTAVLAPLLISFVYGDSFAPAALAFYILLPGALADGVMRPAWSYFAARERIFWRESIAMMGLNIALNLLLIPRLGFAGAAVASSVSYVTLAVWVVEQYRRSTGAGLREILVPTASDARIALRTLREMLIRLVRRSRS